MKKTLLLGVSTAIVISTLTGCTQLGATAYGSKKPNFDGPIYGVNENYIIKEYSNNFIHKNFINEENI